MSAQDDLLANPRELFSRPHLFVVHSGAGEDEALAREIVRHCEGFTRPQVGDLEALRLKSLYGRMFPGITLLILSPVMLSDPAARAALVRQMSLAYNETLFRHYCVCRGMSSASLREYPELQPLLDNVMAGETERSLPAILSEMHDFATRVLPNSPQLARPISEMFYQGSLRRTLAGFALGLLMLLGWAGRLAVPAAVLAGLFWWQGWTPIGTSALIDFAAFYAGFRLNHMQSGDMWPWLGRGWKLPRHSLISDTRPPRFKLIAIGPLSIIGVAFALSYGREARWEEAAVVAVVGLILQIKAELWIRSEIRTRSIFGHDAEKALAAGMTPDAEPSRLSLEAMFRAAGGVVAAFYGGALLTAAFSAMMILAAYLAATMLSAEPGVWIALAAMCGYLVPALLERLGHSGIGYLGGYAGLSSADDGLFKKLASTPNEKLSAEKSVPAGDRPLVEAFAPDEQKLVLQWLGNIRIGLRARSFRRWSPAPDYAFISYAWADDAQTSLASAIADACAGAGIEHFLDKVALKSREGAFRMPLATGLARSTHVFVVVTPGLASGQVVRREIQMAMGRWRGELLPAVICVVEPGVCEQLASDLSVPVAIRFLLRFCPQMTPAEASQPALVRYVVELTRRQGKWSDWRLLLSPSTAMAQVIRLPGIVSEKPKRPG
jgi:hypothetical protein